MTPPPTAAPTPADAIQNVIQGARSVVLRSLRFWPVMAVTVVLSVVAFVLAPRFRAPVYRSEVVLAIRQNLQSDTVLGNEGTAGESRRARNTYLADLLISRPNLRWVIEQENLYASTVAKLGMADAVEDLRTRVKFSGGESNTIVIGVEDGSPERAQLVARRLGESLQRQVGRDSAQRAESTRKFLEQEQTKLGKELQEKEEEYAQFVAQHPEFGLERRYAQTAGGPVALAGRTESETVDSTDPSAALRRQADRVRRRLEQLKNPQAEPAAVPPAQPQLTPESRDAIAAAERDVQQAKQELEARQLQYTGRHPDLLAAQSRLSVAQSRLARIKAAAETYVPQPPAGAPPVPASVQPQTKLELERQLRGLEAGMTTSKGSAKTASSAAPTGSAAAIVSLETQWASLSRDVASLRERYESIQRRLFRAVMVATAETSGGGTQLVVAEEADFPKRPIRRGPIRTGAAVSAGVMALGALLMLGLGYMDQRVVGQWDLDQLGLGPVALVVPRLERKRKSGNHR